MKEIKTLEVDEDEALVSFDVVGLYTNVLVCGSILLVADTLYDGKFDTPPIDEDTFIQICHLCLGNVGDVVYGWYLQAGGGLSDRKSREFSPGKFVAQSI